MNWSLSGDVLLLGHAARNREKSPYLREGLFDNGSLPFRLPLQNRNPLRKRPDDCGIFSILGLGPRDYFFLCFLNLYNSIMNITLFSIVERSRTYKVMPKYCSIDFTSTEH